MKKALLLSGAAGGDGVPVRNGLVAEYKFDECRNLLKYSQQFDNAAWTKGRATVVGNTTTAPDGIATADTWAETAVNGDHYLLMTGTQIYTGVPHTASVYAKKGVGATSPDIIQITLGTAGFGAGQYANYNILTGVVTKTVGCTTSITNVGNGWFRLSYTATATATINDTSLVIATNNNNPDSTRMPTYDGVVTSTVYLWGAQLEVGSAATTYVKTTDKQTLMDYSKPRKNLLLPNQANCCEDGVATWFTKATAGDTVSASTTVAWQGTYSAKVICANAAASEGLYTEYIIPELKPSTSYAASAYVYGSAAGETIKIGLAEYANDKTTLIGTTYANLTLGASWQRVAVTRTFGATGRAARIYVITQSKQACTMYVDGLQLEEGSTATAWEAPPNIGILGSAVGVDTNDPTWTSEGASFTTDDCILLPIQLTTQQTTIVCVKDENAAQQTLLDIGSSGNKGVVLEKIGAHWYVGHKGAARSPALGVDYTNYNVFVITHDNTTSSLWNAPYPSVRTDLTEVVYTGLGSVVGSCGDFTEPMTGTISYFVHYNRILTQAEISKVYAYLKSYLKKNRGIALP